MPLSPQSILYINYETMERGTSQQVWAMSSLEFPCTACNDKKNITDTQKVSWLPGNPPSHKKESPIPTPTKHKHAKEIDWLNKLYIYKTWKNISPNKDTDHFNPKVHWIKITNTLVTILTGSIIASSDVYK